jgi:phosphoglycolate phosphatase-like HAD superfamily hydrolase
MHLILFDIDGTLISSRGVGRRAFARALRHVYGTEGALGSYDSRGKTDPRILHDVLGAAGVPAAVIEARMAACFETYASELEALIGDGECVQPMPGVRELVHGLSGRGETLIGLVTGNIARGAELKLQPTGLLPLFRVGAFGSDHIDRRQLPPIAHARARALAGRDVAFERVTIIGDTPHDVDCARACGAVAVAVATGNYPRVELAACGPDLLFADFSDVAATLAAITAT